MKNADMPAMPTQTYDQNAAMQGLAVTVTEHAGLSKREMVAMHAMQALLSDSENVTAFDTALEWRTNIIEASVEFADLLLAELERTK